MNILDGDPPQENRKRRTGESVKRKKILTADCIVLVKNDFPQREDIKGLIIVHTLTLSAERFITRAYAKASAGRPPTLPLHQGEG
jgi:hypothetical protein